MARNRIEFVDAKYNQRFGSNQQINKRSYNLFCMIWMSDLMYGCHRSTLGLTPILQNAKRKSFDPKQITANVLDFIACWTESFVYFNSKHKWWHSTANFQSKHPNMTYSTAENRKQEKWSVLLIFRGVWLCLGGRASICLLLLSSMQHNVNVKCSRSHLALYFECRFINRNIIANAVFNFILCMQLKQVTPVNCNSHDRIYGCICRECCWP